MINMVSYKSYDKNAKAVDCRVNQTVFGFLDFFALVCLALCIIIVFFSPLVFTKIQLPI